MKPSAVASAAKACRRSDDVSSFEQRYQDGEQSLHPLLLLFGEVGSRVLGLQLQIGMLGLSFRKSV